MFSEKVVRLWRAKNGVKPIRMIENTTKVSSQIPKFVVFLLINYY